MTLARAISYVSLCAFFTIGSIDWAESSERGRLRPDRSTGASAPAKQAQAPARPIVLEPDPPGLCMGHGDLNSISLTDWETGLEDWTVGTHDTAANFDTPDWAVIESLPDSRPGKAAFVADLEAGDDCEFEDITGALTLDSPPILIPADTPVPRVSVDHWFATEFGWDGGNIKISVNGAGFNLIPSSAFEFNPYKSTLFSAAQGNTNPLAGEDAFTGANDQQTGSWGQSHINLFGIAEAEDTIELRFDFGVDCGNGLIGWYVDEVEVYSCSAEPLPGNCGNGVLDTDEECDDGNTFIDDGCSNTCQIEEGWQCTDPTPPGNVLDGSFEAGTPNSSWEEDSTNFDSPICVEGGTECGEGTVTGPADGTFWAWFGGANPEGIGVYEESSLSQAVVIPSTSDELRFELEAGECDSASDYLEVLVDGDQEFLINGSSSLCGNPGYTTQSVDISAYADGASHTVEFHSESFAVNQDVSNFFVDVVSVPGQPSICTIDQIIFFDGFESN